MLRDALFFVLRDVDHRDLHVLAHSCPTRRSSDLDQRRRAVAVPEDALHRLAAHPALAVRALVDGGDDVARLDAPAQVLAADDERLPCGPDSQDRKSTRLNSSHYCANRLRSSA